jgi:hypothetical protein
MNDTERRAIFLRESIRKKHSQNFLEPCYLRLIESMEEFRPTTIPAKESNMLFGKLSNCYE